MRRSVQHALPPMELNPIDAARRADAAAEAASQSLSIALSAVVKDALIRHYGSLKAAAITFGMDQGQLTRELQTGDFKLKKLDGDPDARAFISRAVFEAFGCDSPRARVRRMIRDIRQRCDELEEAIA